MTLASSPSVKLHERNPLPFGRVGVSSFESGKQVSIEVPKTDAVTGLIGLLTDEFQEVPDVKSLTRMIGRCLELLLRVEIIDRQLGRARLGDGLDTRFLRFCKSSAAQNEVAGFDSRWNNHLSRKEAVNCHFYDVESRLGGCDVPGFQRLLEFATLVAKADIVDFALDSNAGHVRTWGSNFEFDTRCITIALCGTIVAPAAKFADA